MPGPDPHPNISLMNKMIVFVLLAISFFNASAQDTLPKFTVTTPGGNNAIIGWTNTFETVKQISIQRSFDSTKNFKTILTVADPTAPQNGYADTKAPNNHMFYRLYILLDKGVYLFSESKRPVLDTVRRYETGSRVEVKMPPVIIGNENIANPVINNKPKAEVYVPSKYVYTYTDGYVRISLPQDVDKKFSIKFYTSEDEFLFEIKDVKERQFKIDKANFYRSGWFRFEIYDGEELFEKHKLYLPKEF